MTIRVGFATRCTAQRRLLVTYTIARSDNGVHICSVETAANGIRCQWRVPRVGRGWCGRRCGVAVRGAIAEYAEIEGVILPFLTLDALQIDHSGTVLIVCVDPRMIAGAHPPEPSRVQQLVTRVRNEPGKPYGLSPHVIAVPCPPRIIADFSLMCRFVEQSAPVLAGATHVIVEAHNGCAALAHFHKAGLERLSRQGSLTPYFELQQGLLERGIQRFAGRVAKLTKQVLVV